MSTHGEGATAGAGASQRRAPGRLNLFQRTMLDWRVLHPYSAVHVARIGATLDEQALVAAIAGQLESWGLTGLELGRRGRYFWAGGRADVALRVVAAEARSTPDVLTREIERELNLRFGDDAPRNPFRFFAVEQDRAFHLGIAYDHFIAGGEAVALLLCAVCRRYLAASGEGQDGGPDGSAAGPQSQPQRYLPTYRRIFAGRPLLLARALAKLPGHFRESSRAWRPRYEDHEDTYNSFLHFHLAASELAAVRRACRAWGVTFNDLFVAMLLLAVSPLAADRLRSRRRTRLAVGSIVSLRRDARVAPGPVFGQLLAALRIAHPVPDGITLRELALDVHRRSSAIKDGREYFHAVLALGLAALAWPLLSDRRRRRFYAKHYPVCGGITTLKVDALPGADAGAAAEYLRGVSTGPMSPLVMALTTAGERVHVSISWRRTAFSREAVEHIARALRTSIGELAGLPVGRDGAAAGEAGK